MFVYTQEHMNTVQCIVDENLCVSCGMCRTVCPKNSIIYKNIDGKGIYVPCIDDQCIGCGRCLAVCPSRMTKGHIKYDEMTAGIPNSYIGKVMEIINCAAVDNEIVKKSTSGGFITQLINSCFEDKLYDSAFLVDTYNYKTLVTTERYGCVSDNRNSVEKSRYIPVSHEKAAVYMKEHRSEKIIIVGTSCCINGILNIIKMERLDRNNYLLVGLFCDGTMNLNVFKYFEQYGQTANTLKKLYFRSKDCSNWPGNVRLEYENDTQIEIPSVERMKIKEFFRLERCLYCLDKLNQAGDFSVGDNYTEEFYDKNGTNSVIIRTERAKQVWENIKTMFKYQYTNIEDIVKAQNIMGRRQNEKNIVLKQSKFLNTNNLTSDITAFDRRIYQNAMNKIKVGNKKNYMLIENQDSMLGIFNLTGDRLMVEEDEQIIFYGAGTSAIRYLNVFRKSYSSKCKVIFCDRKYKTIVTVAGIEVLSVEECISNHNNKKIILTTEKYYSEICKYLIEQEVLLENIYTFDVCEI